MEKFVYIGFIKASGMLENGNPWEGFRIPVGCFGKDGNIIKVDVFKAPCLDSIAKTLTSLKPGSIITCTFDSRGRVAEIKVIPTA